jgi:serine/threonine protein kinase
MYPQAQRLVGQSIGGYQLARLLGSGGVGAVYLGQAREAGGDPVAIKILMPPNQVSPAERQTFPKRFIREAEVLCRLNHPHILPVLAVGDAAELGVVYMIIPYMASGTLATVLRQQRQLPFATIARVTQQIAEALDYAHGYGIIHRDIKPANVLLDERGNAFLADFGMAHLFSNEALMTTSTTTQSQIVRMPEYMAPEQVGCTYVGAATDVYGLGMLSYHLVTGSLPYTATNFIDILFQIVRTSPPWPLDARPELPEAANAAILQALDKDPARRFAAAGDFGRALADGLQGEWVTGVRVPERTPS